MSRSMILGSGELAVALDRFGEVRDFYYPHVGQEDHVRGHYVHHVGVYVGGSMSWLDEDGGWKIDIGSEEDALCSRIVARHAGLAVELQFTDIVYIEQPIFFRRVTVTNHGAAREIKLYFGQQFEIYKAHGGDTAYFDPSSNSVIHYKGRRVFLISALLNGDPMREYAIGIANFHGKEGAWRDADDGRLSLNPIEHGPVDSAVGVFAGYASGESRVCHYWIVAAESIPDARELNHYVLEKSPEHLIERARAHWRTWLEARAISSPTLSPEHVALYKRSLMLAKAHADADGGILASLDSDMLQYGLDTYSYVWPRDSAYIAMALAGAGDRTVAKRFLEFSSDAIADDGYFMHKYLPDGSLGSSWHPWIKNGRLQLPIQEDETALTVIALREYFRLSSDVEFLEKHYSRLVEPAGHFLLHYRDRVTRLPDPSYDLWEEKRGISTFSASAVFAALQAAAELAGAMKREDDARHFAEGAEEVRRAVLENLWDEKSGTFVKHVIREGDKLVYDRVVDSSSAWGVHSFGVLPVDDQRLSRAWEATARKLSHGVHAGGLARYEGDHYYRAERESAGNPWIITTLWYAEYLMARARSPHDLERARDVFSWVVKHAAPSGVLPEQLDPKSGAPLSATPLAWSHAAYVAAVLSYLKRERELAGGSK